MKFEVPENLKMIEIKFKTKIYNKDGETESNLNRMFNILKAARDRPICID